MTQRSWRAATLALDRIYIGQSADTFKPALA
jgi:hypothetical protein